MLSSQCQRLPLRNRAADGRGWREGQIAMRQRARYTTDRHRACAKGAAMAIDTQDLELKLIRRAAGVELSLEPLQGLWTEAQYLTLTNQTNHLIEFTDGVIE